MSELDNLGDTKVINKPDKKNEGCGFFGCRPRLLKRLASGPWVIVLMFFIRASNKMSEYYLSSTLSTTEKYFGFKTKEMSLVFAANDMTSVIITLPLIFYFNKKNKAFWTGVGQIISGLANFLPLVAYLCLTVSAAPTINSDVATELCEDKIQIDIMCHVEKDEPKDWTKLFALVLFFISKLCTGFAVVTYWTIGVSYMDDNINSLAAPAALGSCYIAGYIGGFLGSLLASSCLTLKLDVGDTGSWWLGWPILASFHCILSFLFLLLPKHPETMEEGDLEEEQEEEVPFKLGLVFSAVKRLFKNKVLMFDTLSTTFFIFSRTHKTYMNKFIENQFQVSPSAASLFSGSTNMAATMIAIGISVFFISWYKPSARALALYNFIADIFDLFVGFALIGIITCDISPVQKPELCYSSCGCSNTFSPVCDADSNQNFFSACAAGCTSISNSSDFQNCSCSSGTVSSGYCPTDCATPLKIFLIIRFIQNFINNLGRAGNLLVHIRCVEKKDKALGMAIQEVFIALFAFIPGEILFGSLVDSSCSLWNDLTCGSTGSCLSYDTLDMRVKLLGGAAVVTGIAAVFDGLVWRGVRNMKIY